MDQSDNFDPSARPWTTTQERNRAGLHQWCDLAVGMQAIRGQWKASILIDLSETPRDIPALQARLELANRRVLVRALRELERDQLIARDADGYSLSPHGRVLVKILHDIAAWQASRSIGS